MRFDSKLAGGNSQDKEKFYSKRRQIIFKIDMLNIKLNVFFFLYFFMLQSCGVHAYTGKYLVDG